MKNTKIPILYFAIPIIALAIYFVLIFSIEGTDNSLKIKDLKEITVSISGYELINEEDGDTESILITVQNFKSKFSIDITDIKDLESLKKELSYKKIIAKAFVPVEEDTDNPESIVPIYALLIGDYSATNIDVKYKDKSKEIVFIDADNNELSSPNDYIRKDSTKDPILPLIYLSVLAIGIIYPMFLFFKGEKDSSELILSLTRKETIDIDFNFVTSKSNKIRYNLLILLTVLVIYQVISGIFDINLKFYSAETNFKFLLLSAWILIQYVYQSRKSEVKYLVELTKAKILSYEVKKHKFNYDFYFIALKCEAAGKIITTFIPYFTKKEKYAVSNVSNYTNESQEISLAKHGELYTPERKHKNDINYMIFIDIVIGAAFIIKIFISGF